MLLYNFLLLHYLYIHLYIYYMKSFQLLRMFLHHIVYMHFHSFYILHYMYLMYINLLLYYLMSSMMHLPTKPNLLFLNNPYMHLIDFLHCQLSFHFHMLYML